MGYSFQSKDYKVLENKNGHIHISRDVIFNEDDFSFRRKDVEKNLEFTDLYTFENDIDLDPTNENDPNQT